MKSVPLKVLLYSADDVMTQEVAQALTEGVCARCEVQVAATASAAGERIAHDFPDVILVDLSSLEWPKLDSLRKLRRAASYAPLVVRCREIDAKSVAELFEAGANHVLCDAINAWEEVVLNVDEQWALRIQEKERITHLEQVKRQLEQQVKRLRQLSETAYRFVDTVSHGFRTPLTVINDFATIVRDELVGTINDEQRQHLDVITERVDELTALINDMFEMSQLEMGHLAIKRRVCQVTDVVESAVPLLQHKLRRKDVQLSVDVSGELPKVYCDPDKVRRVLVNLVDDLLGELVAGNWIEVTARHLPERWNVEFQVSDNGAGKSAAVIQAIRQYFSEVDSYARRKSEGLDLGLVIAKELVQLNLGEIEIESGEGLGTTYTFTLPTADIARVSGRYLDKLRQLGRDDLGASLVLVTVPAETAAVLADEVDDFLCRTILSTDLAFRVDGRTWLLLLSGEIHDAEHLLERIESERMQANRNRPRSPLPELQMSVKDHWQFPRDEAGEPPLAQLKSADVRRVLLVDDDRDIVEGAAIRLQSCGFDVLTAYDGSRALEIAGRESLDAILLDIRMPGLDGISVLRQLREQPATAGVPVAIMSGSVKDRETAMSAGAQYFLSKPYRADELIKAVESMSTTTAAI